MKIKLELSNEEVEMILGCIKYNTDNILFGGRPCSFEKQIRYAQLLSLHESISEMKTGVENMPDANDVEFSVN